MYHWQVQSLFAQQMQSHSCHIRHFDLIQALFIAVLGDVFWFIPFYRMVVGKVDQTREMVADKSGTKAGVDAQTLARALLKLGEMARHPPQAALYSALLKHKSSLSSRKEIGDPEMFRRIFLATAVMAIGMTPASAKSLRFTEINAGEFKSVLQGQFEDIVEFRQGDTIPLSVGIHGDIFESSESPATMVTVKRGFFLKASNDSLWMSWDAKEFKPMKEMVSGRLSASVSADDPNSPVTGVALKLDANARN